MKIVYKLLLPLALLVLLLFAFQYFFGIKVARQMLTTYRSQSLKELVKIHSMALSGADMENINSDRTQEKFRMFKYLDISVLRVNIWNRTPSIVYSDDPTLIGGAIDPYVGRVKGAFDYGAFEDQTPRSDDQTFKNKGSFTVLFSPIEDENGKIVAVVEIYASTEELVGDGSFRTKYLAGFLLMFVILMVCKYFILDRVVLRPLQVIEKGAERMGKGNLSERLKVETHDEMGFLAQIINTMAGNLERSHLGLEEKVRVQTEELEKKILAIEDQNGLMNDTKKAILNLLDDAKIMENQLIVEKSSVEQKVVERTQELKAEQARLLASINSLSFGFVIAGLDHKILLKNQALDRILRLKSDVLDSVEDISKVIGDDGLMNEVIGCLSGACGATQGKELTFGGRYLRTIIAPIFMVGENKMLGYVLVLEDITEAKVLERSRDEFFAVASHELRTPLTAIKGNMEMMRDFATKLKKQEKDEMIKDSFDAATRLIGIVNDFLDISRLEQGKITFKKEAFSLEKVVKDVAEKVGPLARSKDLTITLNGASGKYSQVLGDQDRVTQVLFNLLGNAINYTIKGGITVDIEQSEDRLSVSVTDSGKGIAPENQALLFRKFQRADQKVLTRDATGGTGLGLYIAKYIMDGMHGTIELVRSEVGKGSTFRLSLPLADTAVAVSSKK